MISSAASRTGRALAQFEQSGSQRSVQHCAPQFGHKGSGGNRPAFLARLRFTAARFFLR